MASFLRAFCGRGTLYSFLYGHLSVKSNVPPPPRYPNLSKAPLRRYPNFI